MSWIVPIIYSIAGAKGDVNYQIGFICNFSDNILYVTEKDDIMDVEFNDMSNLKTPKQLEQEFLNFKVSNRIALNGYITKFNAVYIIDDGNMVKYIKYYH